jgi:glucokinase
MTASQGIIADIGATNARFALADAGGVYEEKVLKCADYPHIADAVETYLSLAKPEKRPVSAAFAVAGPVTGDRFEMTNHPWSFSRDGTAKRLGFSHFALMNDFVAVALSIPHLAANDRREIGQSAQGPVARAPIGIIGPGTGLGVSSLAWAGGRYIAVPGEGGHVTMPAVTQREFDIFMQLRKDKYHHISAERVCSGKGLANLYHAIDALDKLGLPERDPEQISAAALDGSCPACHEALDLMLSFLGRIAGNLALTLGAHGGIYIAGGILPVIGKFFDDSAFRAEFEGKGRFNEYMKAIPTYLILNKFPAFIGLQADLAGL